MRRSPKYVIPANAGIQVVDLRDDVRRSLVFMGTISLVGVDDASIRLDPRFRGDDGHTGMELLCRPSSQCLTGNPSQRYFREIEKNPYMCERCTAPSSKN